MNAKKLLNYQKTFFTVKITKNIQNTKIQAFKTFFIFFVIISIYSNDVYYCTEEVEKEKNKHNWYSAAKWYWKAI